MYKAPYISLSQYYQIQRLRCTTNQQMKQTNNYTFICQIKIYRNALALTTPKMQVNDKKIYFYRHSLGSCVLYVKTLIYRWLLIENITLLYFSKPLHLYTIAVAPGPL